MINGKKTTNLKLDWKHLTKKSEVEKNQLNNTKTNKKNSNSKELRSNINQRFNSSSIEEEVYT